MSFCDTCQGLHPEWLKQLPQGQRANIFIQLRELKNSATKSQPCPECALIWNALSLYKTDWTDTNFDKFVELVIGLGKPLRLNWHDDLIQLELFSAFKGNIPSQVSELFLETIGPAPKVSEHSESEACFQLAASWLSNCIKNHNSCHPQTSSELPTRLLHVGSAAKCPQLMHTAGQKGHYVALSYCWGTEQSYAFTTTKHTLKAHLREIRFEALSKTLQDAVKITRRLGIDYLWVDALCIIQGDRDDWARESSKMSQVYLNASVTISADNSTGCSKGIFNKQVYGTAARAIPYRNGRSVMVRKAFAQEHNQYALGVRAISEDSEPITCRAWTLQESMLSNRIIRYTTKELVWWCNKAWFCECGGASGIRTRGNSDDMMIRDVAAFAKQPKDDIFEQWGEIVQRMTERSLTNGSDKLPALSGLATQFAKVLQIASNSSTTDGYLAGHWRSNLVKSLYWTAESDFYGESRIETLICQRAKPWRAPTWSWASLDGPVEYAPGLSLDPCLEVIEASTTITTADLYGQVSSGKLSVQGQVIHDMPIEISKIRKGDLFGGFTAGLTYAIRNADGLRTFTIDDRNDYSGCKIGLNNVGFSCLLIGYVTVKGAVIDQEEVFLVLRPKTGMGTISSASPRVFERVGASLRWYKEPNMDTLGESTRDNNSTTKVTRLFDTAARQTIVIV